MKLRTQIIAAFLLLATTPLVLSVLYTYFTSRDAVRKAVETEATLLAQDMDSRMGAIRRNLESRVARLADLPTWAATPQVDDGTLQPPAPPTPEQLWQRMRNELGDSASLIESFELIPISELDEIEVEGDVSEVHDVDIDLPDDFGDDLDTDFDDQTDHLADSFVVPFDGTEIAEALRGLASGEETEILVESLEHSLTSGLKMAVIALGELEEGVDFGGDETEQHMAELEERLEEEIGKLEERIEARHEARNEANEERRKQHLERVAQREHQREIERQKRAVLRSREAQRRRDLDPEAIILHQQRLRDTRLLLGEELRVPLEEDGTIVARIKPQISAQELLGRVLGKTRRDQGELPYALDAEGNLYVADEKDRPLLQSLPLAPTNSESRDSRHHNDWVIETAVDEKSGLIFGIARPIGDSLAQLGRTSARNLAFGVALIALSLLGIIPFANRISRNLERLTEGAERIAEGDLETRVEVAGRGEVGQLASAFNRMAHDLESHQRQLIEEEGKRREQELEQRLLRVDLDRKNTELEEAREFQLSMLPAVLPVDPSFELAVAMKTATEVGGDYYDFRHREDGSLIIAIGDATGHGSKAATLVTAIKGLFSAYSGTAPLAVFLERAHQAIRTMNLDRMTMALTVARFHQNRLQLAAAGMPPVYVHRGRSNRIEEISAAAMPLGGLTDRYREAEVDLEAGDTVLMMTDGFPELLDAEGGGNPFGYQQSETSFAAAASLPPEELIQKLVEDAVDWGGDTPEDDYTFVVLRVR